MLRAGGSLYKFLGEYRKNRRVLSWMAALKWASDIASGMEHLHSHDLVHLDLKSPNVLLTKRSLTANAKICNFGILTTTMSLTPVSAMRDIVVDEYDALLEEDRPPAICVSAVIPLTFKDRLTVCSIADAGMDGSRIARREEPDQPAGRRVFLRHGDVRAADNAPPI